MKKKIALVLSVFIFTTSVQLMAQQDDSALLAVTYHFIHIADTTDRANPVNRDMVLLVSQSNSRYQNAKRWKQFVASEKARAAMMNANRSTAVAAISVSGGLAATVSTPGINAHFYQLPKERKIIQTEYVGSTQYRITENMPAINWRVESESRTIGGYTCQKATGTYGGRMYTAWFTTALPFSYGPWKLCGLPGLILEAADATGDVKFEFAGIEADSASHHLSLGTGKMVDVTEESLLKLNNAYMEDPAATVQSQYPSYNRPISVFYSDESGKFYSGDEAKEAIRLLLKKKVNNPLELKK